MPKCWNCDKYYTGSEKSPKGNGYHACAEDVYSEKIGTDNHVWHVVEFGKKRTKRWQKGLSPTTDYMYPGLILELPRMEPGMGLLIPNKNPYSPDAWCRYHYKTIDDSHVEIIENELGLEVTPMTQADFIALYKKIHGQHTPNKSTA